MTDIRLDDTPSLGSILNDADGAVSGVEKLRAQRGHSSLVMLSRLDEFGFASPW